MRTSFFSCGTDNEWIPQNAPTDARWYMTDNSVPRVNNSEKKRMQQQQNIAPENKEIMSPTPAQRQQKHQQQQRELGGRTYELDPSRLDTGNYGSVIVKTIVVLALFPLLLFIALISTFFMYVGPTRWKHTLVSSLLPRMCGKLDEKWKVERQYLLSDCGGRVLDVGCGGGAYLPYFAPQKEATTTTHIVALEPLSQLHGAIRQTANSCQIPQDRLEIYAMNVEEYLREQKNTKEDLLLFDWIILGNVLCEVEDQMSTLKAIDQLLKPGTGRIYFSEHVACPHGYWMHRVQHWINPWWHTISGGCNINRDTLQAIRCMPDWEVISWSFPKRTVELNPFVLGLALKRKNKHI